MIRFLSIKWEKKCLSSCGKILYEGRLGHSIKTSLQPLRSHPSPADSKPSQCDQCDQCDVLLVFTFSGMMNKPPGLHPTHSLLRTALLGAATSVSESLLTHTSHLIQSRSNLGFKHCHSLSHTFCSVYTVPYSRGSYQNPHRWDSLPHRLLLAPQNSCSQGPV